MMHATGLRSVFFSKPGGNEFQFASFAKDAIATVVTMLLAILLAAGPFVFGCGSLVASMPPRGGGGWKKYLLLLHCLTSGVNAGEEL